MQKPHLNFSKQSMTQSIVDEDIARNELEKVIQKLENILSPHLSELYRNNLRKMMLIQIHQFHGDIARQMDVIQRDHQKNCNFASIFRLTSAFETTSKAKLDALSLSSS